MRISSTDTSLPPLTVVAGMPHIFSASNTQSPLVSTVSKPKHTSTIKITRTVGATSTRSPSTYSMSTDSANADPALSQTVTIAPITIAGIAVIVLVIFLIVQYPCFRRDFRERLLRRRHQSIDTTIWDPTPIELQMGQNTKGPRSTTEPRPYAYGGQRSQAAFYSSPTDNRNVTEPTNHGWNHTYSTTHVGHVEMWLPSPRRLASPSPRRQSLLLGLHSSNPLPQDSIITVPMDLVGNVGTGDNHGSVMVKMMHGTLTKNAGESMEEIALGSDKHDRDHEKYEKA